MTEIIPPLPGTPALLQLPEHTDPAAKPGRSTDRSNRWVWVRIYGGSSYSVWTKVKLFIVQSLKQTPLPHTYVQKVCCWWDFFPKTPGKSRWRMPSSSPTEWLRRYSIYWFCCHLANSEVSLRNRPQKIRIMSKSLHVELGTRDRRRSNGKELSPK